MIVYRKSIELVRLIQALESELRAKDRELAEQLHRAVRSIVLNIAEGRSQRGRRKTNHFAIALGSGRETHACLELAAALRLVGTSSLAAPLSLSDEIQAMLYRLSR